MGLSPERVVGKALSDFLAPHSAEEKTKYYRRAWNGEENVKYEAQINGIWYFASLRPIRRGGHAVEVIGSCVDITDKKEMEQRLKDSEFKYRLIAENTQDLIRVLDSNGIIRYASPSHKNVLGFPPSVYESQLTFELMHPDDIRKTKEQFFKIISTKTPCRLEFRYKHVDGRWVHVESSGTPVINEKGEVESIVAVGRDITERKKTEEIILKSEKLSVVGQLGSSIAHEIRNPLTSIKGFAQLLRKEVEKPFYIDTILSEISRIESVLHEFLEFAKIKKYNIKEANVNALLNKVLSIFSSQAIEKNITIIHEFSSVLPSIHCDENLIKQVFINILQNAVEAMPNGGEIKIETLRLDSDNIKIQFIDNGVGMTEERIKNIGEPFYSLTEKGTGLGLMVCNKIILEHQGTINIKSKINQGTILDVILPIGLLL